jgi:hypothetical protein
MVRTNHFLSAPLNVRGDPAFASSFYRYDRSCEIVRSALMAASPGVALSFNSAAFCVLAGTCAVATLSTRR